MTMNNQVTAFNFNTSSIRVVTLEGNPWFVGADVLHVLYGRADGLGHVYDCVGADEVQSVNPSHFKLGKGVARKLLSESGLYKLIMRSDKPQAKAFQDWVTKEVLPSIRKTGSFVTGQPSLVENPQMSALHSSSPQVGQQSHHKGLCTQVSAAPKYQPYEAPQGN